MSSDAVTCPRCNRDAGTLQFVPPDMLSRELVDSLDDGDRSLAGAGDAEVCRECMDELKQNISDGV
jgi:hypothetical protein